MPPKKYFRITIDIGMFLQFLLLMGAHLTPVALHEWFGIGLFLCFLVHNILNYRWYKALFKGKYTLLRTTQTTVNFLLLVAVIGCIASALMISGVVFSGIRLPGIEFGRGLHMLCTAWGFVLMSVHLGLHIKTPKTVKTLRIILYAIAVCGIFVFAERKLWEELFLLTEYKWFDYDKNVVVYLFETLAVSMSFATLAYNIKKWGLLATKEKQNHII